MKICTKCGEIKPRTEFYEDKSKLDGLKPNCKVCIAEYRAKNKEHARAYYAANRYLINANSTKWASANPESRNAASARWRAANPGREKATAANWRAANPDKMRINNHNRRARKRAAVGTLSHGLANKLLKLQRGKCPCCGFPLGNDYHIDHKMPIALGGTNTDDNCQLLRKLCNLQKSDKHPVEFMQSRGFLL